MADVKANLEHNKVADELFRAVTAGDMDSVGRLYAEDIAVWHNYNNIVQSRAENLQLLSNIPNIFDTLNYANIRRHPIEGGIVQQHDLVVRHKDGRDVTVHVCMILSIKEGKVTRIEEYLDIAQLGL